MVANFANSTSLAKYNHSSRDKFHRIYFLHATGISSRHNSTPKRDLVDSMETKISAHYSSKTHLMAYSHGKAAWGFCRVHTARSKESGMFLVWKSTWKSYITNTGIRLLQFTGSQNYCTGIFLSATIRWMDEDASTVFNNPELILKPHFRNRFLRRATSFSKLGTQLWESLSWSLVEWGKD